MTNANHNYYLLKLGGKALGRPTRDVYRQLHGNSPLELDRHVFRNKNIRFYNLIQPILQRTIREVHGPGADGSGKTGEKTGDNYQEDQSSSSNSSHHQQYHRRRYEQKRSQYQKEKIDQNGSRGSLSSENLTHYQRLNVEPGVDVGAIKSAYYSLSKLYHPDTVGSHDSQSLENFRLITESYNVLSDPRARADYDRQLNSMNEKNNLDMAWKPMASSDRQRTVFRMRDANMIFRMKQQEAFELEKLRNPKKFQAGSFARDEDYTVNTQAERERLVRRLRNFRETSYTTESKGGDDFYRMHLYNVIQRRREAYCIDEPRTMTDISASGSYGIMTVLAMTLGATTLVGALIILNLMYDIDIAADLDRGLDRKVQEHRKK